MANFSTWLSELPWGIAVLLCLTLGLAPFNPPHLFEKLQMISTDWRLMKPIDYFDLLMHASPWVLLALKGLQTMGLFGIGTTEVG